MTVESITVAPRQATLPKALAKGPTPPRANSVFTFKLLFTIAIVAAYIGFRSAAVDWLSTCALVWTGYSLHAATGSLVLTAWLFTTILVLWRETLFKDPRFQAPLLITAILAVADAGYGILDNHSSPWLRDLTGGLITTYSPTFVAIVSAVLVEMTAGWFFWGKMPHLASAYISGISAGILIKSPLLWPYVFCVLISILSKYVLRTGERHLWNPTNFGVTMMLFLAPNAVASLSVQAGNEVWGPLIIWLMGSLIMLRLRRFYIPLTFIAVFIPLAFLRAGVTQHPWEAELAPFTWPMFQLFIFFMITDPKTTVHAKWGQIVVVTLVAVMDTVLRLGFEDVHSFYHALFIVGPIANVIEISWDRFHARNPSLVPAVS
jgi:hypothetical protein